nr:MAG TPA: hypothetical protein [Caudoviricetes sp.]
MRKAIGVRLDGTRYCLSKAGYRYGSSKWRSET